MTDINVDFNIETQLFGRRDIYATSDTVTEDNVIALVNNAMTYHMMNFNEEDYLYWRRRGLSPIFARQKKYNNFVLNKISENHADEIVNFKNGFLFPQNSFYTARNEAAVDKAKELNEYIYLAGKPAADNKVADWFHTVGKGVIYIDPKSDDPKIPAKVYALDPRSAFVVYSLKPGNAPVMGVYMVIVDSVVMFDVFTRDRVFHLRGSNTGTGTTTFPLREATAIELINSEPNYLGEIPMIEYRYNTVNMGAFEAVITLLTMLDKLASDRLDGVDQFIQSLIVTYNVEFDDGVTASKIREMGIVPLKSTADSKGDIKILSEELNQSQTQTLVDYTYDQILTICMMPSNRKGGASTSDTGAASLYRDGWVQAETCAANTQDLFRESNKQFDRIFAKILRDKGLLDIDPTDYELTFVRAEMANIQSKAQAFQTLVSGGLHPVLAMAKSGVSNDPVNDFQMSDKYLKMIWGDPDKVDEQPDGQGEAEIIEEDNSNGDGATGTDL